MTLVMQRRVRAALVIAVASTLTVACQNTSPTGPSTSKSASKSTSTSQSQPTNKSGSPAPSSSNPTSGTARTPSNPEPTVATVPFSTWVELGRTNRGFDDGDVSSFSTPSGNIACYISADDSSQGATCILKSHTYQNAPKPSQCGRYWATDHVKLDSERGVEGGACLGGLDFDTSTVRATLGYGEFATQGVISCRSEQSGMSCANTSTGIGFTVSRRALIKRSASDVVSLPAWPAS